MFVDMGYNVTGNWDFGSKERPKIKGVTDRNYRITEDGSDLVILHQVPNYTTVMRELLEAGKRVILTAFGQSDTWQYVETAKLCNKFEHAYIANYSKKDLRLHAEAGCSDDKSRLIRFAKYLDDFKPWNGKQGTAYCCCNNIHNRGPGCRWDLMEQLINKCPVTLSGVNTNEVGGLGQISVDEMHERFANSACSVSFGTAPAAMTLGQIEAVCAGTPLVLFDNGYGARDEGLTKMIYSNVNDMAMHINSLIREPFYRNQKHEESLEASKMFDVKNIIPQWEELIERVMV